MYYIFKNKFYGAKLVGLLVTVALSAGCCVAPFDEGSLHEYHLPRDTERFFWGFTDEPNERISVQRLVDEGGSENWETIIEVRPQPVAFSGYAGLEYYMWHADLDLANPTWWHFDRGWVRNRDLVVNGNEYSMKVRLVDSQGRLLFTYKYPLLLRELLHANPVDLWKEKGNRQEFLLLRLYRPGEASDGWEGHTNDGRIFH